MRTIIIFTVKFFMMEPGEKLPDLYANQDFTQGYVIWPRKNGMWDVRWRKLRDWEEISSKQFPTENAAFNAAYDHMVEQQKKRP